MQLLSTEHKKQTKQKHTPPKKTRRPPTRIPRVIRRRSPPAAPAGRAGSASGARWPSLQDRKGSLAVSPAKKVTSSASLLAAKMENPGGKKLVFFDLPGQNAPKFVYLADCPCDIPEGTFRFLHGLFRWLMILHGLFRMVHVFIVLSTLAPANIPYQRALDFLVG